MPRFRAMRPVRTEVGVQVLVDAAEDSASADALLTTVVWNALHRGKTGRVPKDQSLSMVRDSGSADARERRVRILRRPCAHPVRTRDTSPSLLRVTAHTAAARLAFCSLRHLSVKWNGRVACLLPRTGQRDREEQGQGQGERRAARRPLALPSLRARSPWRRYPQEEGQEL